MAVPQCKNLEITRVNYASLDCETFQQDYFRAAVPGETSSQKVIKLGL